MDRRAPICLLALLTCACLEPPALDELPPTPTDLGGLDGWGPLDGPMPSSALDETGPPPSLDSTGADSGGLEPDPNLAWLRLTEILVDPDGKDGGAESPEFIEIKNTGDQPVNLEGLILDALSWPQLDGGQLGLAGVDLDPGAYLVIQRWATDVDPSLAEPRDIRTAYFVGFLDGDGLRNADGHVRLSSPLDAIDEFVYGAPAEVDLGGWIGAPFEDSPSGDSMCRVDESADHDDRSDWASCTPSPGAADSSGGASRPTPIPPGAIQIVEVHANPPGLSSEEKSLEFIELINLSENEVELFGCRISDALEHDAPGVDPLAYHAGDGGCASPECLAPGARAIIVGQGYTGPTGSGLVLTTDDSTIADGGLTNTEPVVLWDGSGARVSSYRDWLDPSADPLPSEEGSLHRLDPAGLDEALNWIAAPATPGD